MAAAANRIVENRGGIVVVARRRRCWPSVVLEIAGIMSDQPLDRDEREAGGVPRTRRSVSASAAGIDPFMTLSFMALPVIPTLRITTRGVIDVNTQQYI